MMSVQGPEDKQNRPHIPVATAHVLFMHSLDTVSVWFPIQVPPQPCILRPPRVTGPSLCQGK